MTKKVTRFFFLFSRSRQESNYGRTRDKHRWMEILAVGRPALHIRHTGEEGLHSRLFLLRLIIALALCLYYGMGGRGSACIYKGGVFCWCAG